MRVENRKLRTNLCIVERNALAGAYLHEILNCDPSIRIFSEYTALSGGPGIGTSKPIFVIDIDTLRSPVAIYLTVLRSRFAHAKVLFLGKELSTEELRRLPFLGIQGFVPYNDVKDQLRPAIQAISNGRDWFAPEVFEEFPTYRAALWSEEGPLQEASDIFTPREKLVIGLVQRRLGNKEISSALRISESTVKFHLSNIFRKLGVNDRASAAEAAAPLLTQAKLSPQPCTRTSP